MRSLRFAASLALALLAPAAAGQAGTISINAPLYTSNKAGTKFKPFSSSKTFQVTVRLYNGPQGEPLMDALGLPWEESFVCTAVSTAPSQPSSGEISSPTKVKGQIHLLIGASSPLPDNLQTQDTWLTTQVFTLNKGVVKKEYFESPPQPLGVAGIVVGQEIDPKNVSVNGLLVIDELGNWVGNPIPASQGPVGPEGPEGPQGPIGPAGAQGDPGPQGVQGEIGPTGSQGDAGSQGPQGIEGPQGPAGVDGPQGVAGPQGPQGVTGPQGTQGAVGPQGPQGPLGNPGPQGVAGPTGDPGADGLQGPEGPAGPAGPQGDAGPEGAPGTIGPQGLEGPAGPAGPQGDAGPQGIPGTIGPQGPDGPAGPAGPEGVAGPQGPVGPQGPEGDLGPQGLEGPIGPQGPQGPAGPTGQQGLTGSQGPQGDTGSQGVPGPAGSTGPQGPVGPMGPPGPGDVKVRKTVDESASNNTTPQNDDQLFFAVAAGEVWLFDYWLVVSAESNQPDIKLAFTVPAGTTLRWCGFGPGNAGFDHPVVSSSGGSDGFAITGGIIKDSIWVRGIVTVGGTAGTVRLQWAQNNASFNDTTVEANSYLQAAKF